MTKRSVESLDELFAEWDREAKTSESLRKVEDWYKEKLDEIWEPYHRKIQRLTARGITLTAKMRDKIAEETGATLRNKVLLKVYDSVVKELMDKAASKLLDPDSDEFKETVQKYDQAWRELAKR